MPEGRQTLPDHPDRLELVNMEISDLGYKVIAQYAVLGPYDFVTTIEAPENRDMRSGMSKLRRLRRWVWG